MASKSNREPTGPAVKSDIEKPLAELGEVVVKATLHAEQLRDKGDIVAMVKTMDRLNTLHDRIKAVNAEVSKLLDTVRFSYLPDMMDEGDVKNISVDGIGLCYLSDDISVKQHDKDAVKEWLIKNGFEDIVTETVNAQTLAAFIKGRIRSGEDYPTDLIGVKPFTRAAIKSAK